jgi:putative endonuclease
VNEGAYLYIVRCSDGSLYIGTTRTALEIRIAKHNDGTFEGYTRSRRPVVLVFSQWFDRITDAIENERKLKKWSRAKKEAFIRGDFGSLQQLAKRNSPILRDARLRRLLRMREEWSGAASTRPVDSPVESVRG